MRRAGALLWAFAAPLLACGRAPEPAPPPCGGCHAAAWSAWSGSHHALAERPFGPSEPVPAAVTARAGPDGTWPPAAIIGVEPLRQLVVATPGGRFRVLDPAWDGRTGEIFSIVGEAPAPANAQIWNADCAPCHVSGLEAGYDPATDAYRTVFRARGVDCEVCHAPHPAPAPGAEVCLPCHARREPLLADPPRGGRFEDAYRLWLVETPELYFADGQARDEVFEVGSLRLSAMGHRGIDCLDCHEPHGGRLRGLPAPARPAPADIDALCLRCHAPGAAQSRLGPAPPIDAAAHRAHPPGPGGNCVDCHMPERTYMGRDRRRDHGFTVPDPALAAEIGAPDACTGCHADRGAPWIAAASARMHGARLVQRPSRVRAQILAATWRNTPGAAQALALRLATEPNAAWRAVFVGALTPFAEVPAVEAALSGRLDDPDPLVRAGTVRALARLPVHRPRLVALRADPVRAVRLAALWATRATVTDEPAAAAELTAWLAVSSDQPAGALRQSEWALLRGDLAAAERWARRAVAWEPSAPTYGTLARVLAAAGRAAEATEALRAGGLAP